MRRFLLPSLLSPFHCSATGSEMCSVQEREAPGGPACRVLAPLSFPARHNSWLLGAGYRTRAAQARACPREGQGALDEPSLGPLSPALLCFWHWAQPEHTDGSRLALPGHQILQGEAALAPPTTLTFFFSGDVWLLLASPSTSRSQVRGSQPGAGLTPLPEWSSLGFHPLKLTPAAHHS